MTMKPMKHQAFSLVEVLAAVAIIGIVTFLAVPNIVRIKQDGEDNLARARAEALQTAMASYVQAVGPSAAQDWWAANTDAQERFEEISAFLAFPESNLVNGFFPTGYTVTLPTSIYPMNTRIIVARGTTQVYP